MAFGSVADDTPQRRLALKKHPALLRELERRAAETVGAATRAPS